MSVLGIYFLLREGDFVPIYRIPVSKLYLGSVLLLIGILALFNFLFKRNNFQNQKYIMCLTCRQPFYEKETQDGICPKCGNIVEDMEGIFERHPDLKNSTLKT